MRPELEMETDTQRPASTPQARITALQWATIAARCSARMMEMDGINADAAWDTVYALEDLMDDVVPMLRRQVQ